jgi:hypothetical protein
MRLDPALLWIGITSFDSKNCFLAGDAVEEKKKLFGIFCRGLGPLTD